MQFCPCPHPIQTTSDRSQQLLADVTLNSQTQLQQRTIQAFRFFQATASCRQGRRKRARRSRRSWLYNKRRGTRVTQLINRPTMSCGANYLTHSVNRCSRPSVAARTGHCLLIRREAAWRPTECGKQRSTSQPAAEHAKLGLQTRRTPRDRKATSKTGNTWQLYK